jgi:hypothetical protein
LFIFAFTVGTYFLLIVASAFAGVLVYKKAILHCFQSRNTLREARRLRVLENRVLRRIFGSKRDEVIGGWRKLHNVLFAKYNYNYQVKEDEMVGACSTNVGEEECI